jgi:6-phosphogluconate dehydrogenase
VRLGVPIPAFSSALAYYDGYRRERLPANLIQAQRDLFGAHTYERTDRPGTFHSHWGEAPDARPGEAANAEIPAPEGSASVRPRA